MQRSLGSGGTTADSRARRRRAVSGRRYAGRPRKGIVIASESEAIQGGLCKNLDCFVASAPRNDERAYTP
jgi:hypothetical protein